MSVVIAILYFVVNKKEEVINYVAVNTPNTEVKQVEKLDTVSEAQKQLDQAKKMLDDEDTKLKAEVESIKTESETKVSDKEVKHKAEIESIEAEAKAKVAEKELRLEEIRKVRLGFSQAPEQTN